MASSSSLSDDEVERRIADAQNVPLDLEKCTTPLIAKYVGDHSSSIGCPKQFFLIPLQSIAAHFMGPKLMLKYMKVGVSLLSYGELLFTKAKKIARSWILS